MKLYLVTFLFFVIYKNKTFVDCVTKKQDVYLDDEFKSFTFFFGYNISKECILSFYFVLLFFFYRFLLLIIFFLASSPSANFLSRIVHSNEAKFTQIKNKTGLIILFY